MTPPPARRTRRSLLRGGALLALGARSAGAQGAPSSVDRWGRFEGLVRNLRPYADPYTGVTLEVTYTRPDGSSFRFDGFHDGGTTWRFRCMPDAPGTWRYRAAFSDGTPGTSGTFECVPSDLPGLLSRYEANPLWFGYRGGKPVVVRSFHVGDRFFASNWPADRRTAFLDWAQSQGYNTLSIASHYLNRGSETRGRGWATPDLWPLNAAEFRRMESVLDDLARRRIHVFPFAGFFGRDSDFPIDPADQTRFLRYAVARLGAYWNLLFNVGGPEPLLRGKPYLTVEDIDRLGEEIRKADPFGHLLAVHNSPGDDPFRDREWSTYGVLQGPKTVDRALLGETLRRNHHPRKPLFAQETLWPGNTFGHPRYSDDDIRKNAWVILMSGAALNFGDMNGSSTSGFSDTMDPADRVLSRHDGVKRVWDLFETLPYARTRPRQELVNTGFCLADEGKTYLVYLDRGQKLTLSLPDAAARAEWINPRDPRDRRPAGDLRGSGTLTPPEGGSDWLLHATV